jgi:hypothetical protein
MHEHTRKAVATLGAEAPLIKAIASLPAETILTKTVATVEHVETLDMMRVTVVVEESNGATTLPDVEAKDHVPTTVGGDTLGRDGDRNEVWGMCATSLSWTASLSCTPLCDFMLSCSAKPTSRAPKLTCAASLVAYSCAPHLLGTTRGSLARRPLFMSYPPISLALPEAP